VCLSVSLSCFSFVLFLPSFFSLLPLGVNSQRPHRRPLQDSPAGQKLLAVPMFTQPSLPRTSCS
jgi:hypothetical protein